MIVSDRFWEDSFDADVWNSLCWWKKNIKGEQHVFPLAVQVTVLFWFLCYASELFSIHEILRVIIIFIHLQPPCNSMWRLNSARPSIASNISPVICQCSRPLEPLLLWVNTLRAGSHPICGNWALWHIPAVASPLSFQSGVPKNVAQTVLLEQTSARAALQEQSQDMCVWKMLQVD